MSSLGINISLDADLISSLQAEANECHITLRDLIRSVLQQHVMEQQHGE